MAIAFVQSAVGNSSETSTTTCNLGVSPTVGNVLFVQAATGKETQSALMPTVDAGGTQFTLIGDIANGTNAHVRLYYKVVDATDGTTITANWGGQKPKGAAIECVEFSGVDTTTVHGTAATRIGSGTSLTWTTVSMTAGNLALGGLGSSSGGTLSSLTAGYTSVTSSNVLAGGAIIYQLLNTGGNQSPSCTYSGAAMGWATVLVEVNAASGGSGPQTIPADAPVTLAGPNDATVSTAITMIAQSFGTVTDFHLSLGFNDPTVVHVQHATAVTLAGANDAVASPGPVTVVADAPVTLAGPNDATASGAATVAADAPVALAGPNDATVSTALTVSADAPVTIAGANDATVTSTLTVSADAPVTIAGANDATTTTGQNVAADTPVTLAGPNDATFTSAITVAADAGITLAGANDATAGAAVTTQAIARKSFVDRKVVSGTARLSCVAFSVHGIASVDFSLGALGPVNVTSMATNPDTNLHEYFAAFNTTSLADGLTAYTITVNPAQGTVRTITGNVWVNNSASLFSQVAHVSTTGNDTTGDGSLGNPYATIKKAVDVLHVADTGGQGGGTVSLAAGSYPFPDTTSYPSNYVTETWVTITHDSGVTRDQVVIVDDPAVQAGDGIRTSYVRFQDVTLRSMTVDSRNPAQLSTALWLDTCIFEGVHRADPLTPFETSSWDLGVYYTDCEVRKMSDVYVPGTVANIELVLGGTVHQYGQDAFKNFSGLAANVTVYDQPDVTYVATAVVAAGGTGYAVNDTVKLAAAGATFAETLTVTAVTGGVVTALAITDGGEWATGSEPTGVAEATTTLTGSGTGLTLNMSGVGAWGSYHQDAFQGATNPIDNSILYQCRFTAGFNQGIFISDVLHQNIAIVGNLVESIATGGTRMSLSSDVTHIYYEGNTFQGIASLFEGNAGVPWTWTDVHILNNIFDSGTGFTNGQTVASVTADSNHFIDPADVFGTNATSGTGDFADQPNDDYTVGSLSTAYQSGAAAPLGSANRTVALNGSATTPTRGAWLSVTAPPASGGVNADAPVTLSGANDATVSATITVAADTPVTVAGANDATATAGLTVAADAPVTLSGANDATSSATITVAADAPITLAGASDATASSAITVAADAPVTLAGANDATATAGLTVAADTPVTLAGANDATTATGPVTVPADAPVQLAGANDATVHATVTVVADIPVTLSGANDAVTTGGIVAAASTVTLSGANDATFTTAVTVGADAPVLVSGANDATGTVGAVTVQASTVTLTGPNDATFATTITVTDSAFTISGANDANAGSALGSYSGTTTSTGALDATGTSWGTLIAYTTSSGGLDLMATGTLYLSTTSTGDITATAQCGAVLDSCDPLCVVDIWNIATAELGLPEIQDKMESTPQANAIRSVWKLVRQRFLADHSWNGATRSIALTQSATHTPIHRWKYAYDLPTCYLRILEINDNLPAERWEVKVHPNRTSRLLYTDESSVDIVYVVDLETVDTLSPMTAYALGLELSLQVAPAFGKTATEIQQITLHRDKALRDAKGVDGQEQSPEIPTMGRTILEARDGYRSWYPTGAF